MAYDPDDRDRRDGGEDREPILVGGDDDDGGSGDDEDWYEEDLGPEPEYTSTGKSGAAVKIVSVCLVVVLVGAILYLYKKSTDQPPAPPAVPVQTAAVPARSAPTLHPTGPDDTVAASVREGVEPAGVDAATGARAEDAIADVTDAEAAQSPRDSGADEAASRGAGEAAAGARLESGPRQGGGMGFEPSPVQPPPVTQPDGEGPETTSSGPDEGTPTDDGTTGIVSGTSGGLQVSLPNLGDPGGDGTPLVMSGTAGAAVIVPAGPEADAGNASDISAESAPEAARAEPSAPAALGSAPGIAPLPAVPDAPDRPRVVPQPSRSDTAAVEAPSAENADGPEIGSASPAGAEADAASPASAATDAVSPPAARSATAAASESPASSSRTAAPSEPAASPRVAAPSEPAASQRAAAPSEPAASQRAAAPSEPAASQRAAASSASAAQTTTTGTSTPSSRAASSPTPAASPSATPSDTAAAASSPRTTTASRTVAAPAPAPAASSAPAGPSAPVASTPTPSSSSGAAAATEEAASAAWTVTFASLIKTRPEAQQILDRIKALGGGGNFYLTEFSQNGSNYFRVRMGFYRSHTAAMAAGKELADKAGAYSDLWAERASESEFKANGAKVVD